MDKLIVISETEEYSDRARRLSEELNAPLQSEADINAAEDTVYLRVGPDGLVLTDGELSITGDFTRLLPRIRQNKANTEYITKAARIKGCTTLSVFDATAGLGEDSFLLSAAGCTVTLCEKDPVIAALLSDAVDKAQKDPELEEIASRMHVLHWDSIEFMKAMTEGPDVIILDPMFPERRKSALVKKKFQLIHLLEAPCSDEEDLLNAALSAHPKKIVIKRPPKGPFLAGFRPSYSITGKAVRYDCIVL